MAVYYIGVWLGVVLCLARQGVGGYKAYKAYIKDRVDVYRGIKLYYIYSNNLLNYEFGILLIKLLV